MAVAAGTYIVVSALNTSRALDVSGGSQARGANVQIYTRNNTDAQYVTVTGSGTSQTLRFIMTGRVLDVAGGAARDGNNVQQWDGNNTASQQWNIVADGKTVTIGGTSYPTYLVKSKLNQSYMLDVAGGSSSPGTNVQIYKGNGTNSQRWAFVPVNLLPKGDYYLLSALDQKACISAANAKDGANVQVAGLNEGDDKQVWRFSYTGDVATIQNVQSKCYLTAKSGDKGANVIQKSKADGQYSKWLTTQAGTMKYNGGTYPLVEIALQAGAGERLDVAGGKTSAGTNVQVWDDNDSKSQRFLAVPALPFNRSVPAPSDLGLAYKLGGERNKNLWGRGKVSLFPTFVGNYSDYQMRYRYRVRKVGTPDASFQAWTAWKNVANGSTANNGWGDVKKAWYRPTLRKDPNGRARRYVKQSNFTVNTTGNDLVEYQYEVRAMAKYKYGNSATFTGRVKFKPIFTLEGITWTPDGLNFKFHADQKRSNNDLVIYKVTCVSEGKTRTIYDGGSTGYMDSDLKWSDTALLPQKYVKYIPNAGDVVTATVRYSNTDGAYNTSRQKVSAACSYGSGKGMAITPTIEYTDGYMLHIDANMDADEYHAWIDYYDDQKGFSKYPDEDGEWHIPVLANKPYRVFVIAKKGVKWDVYSRTMPAMGASDVYLFNFETASGVQDWFQVKVNEGDPPVFTRSLQADFDAQLTNGTTFEVVHFGRGRSEEIGVEGSKPLTLTIPNGTVAKAEAMFSAHYAWLRTPNDSTVYRIAVTGLEIDYQNPTHTQITLQIKRINAPTEY